jgi:hypothetical protein
VSGAFPGFGISGYRSIYGEPQWIDLSNDVTVVLGGNNSGKSNVLRLVNEHMGSLHNAAMGQASNVKLDTFVDRDDSPRGLESPPFLVDWPIDLVSLSSTQGWEELSPLLGHEAIIRHGVPTLPLESANLRGQLTLPADLGESLTSDLPEVNWNRLSSALTSLSGGAHGADAQRVLEWLRTHLASPPRTAFVPPSRSMRSGDEVAEWDFGGAGVVEKLKRILNPEFYEDELRVQALALRDDLRILLEESELEYEVPASQSTVNLRIGGHFYPLSSLGTGTEHAVLILAARHVHPDRLLVLEEPDAHLHPRLQRRLMELLRATPEHGIVVATHSPHIIDGARDTVVAATLSQGRTTLRTVGSPELFGELRALGYRASDLLQANALIWVEGPSDRIYLLHWLKAAAPELVEGVDFSIVFYGGALLARLSAGTEGPSVPSLVDLWNVNRRMWLVMDSDQGERELKPAVIRLQSEIEQSEHGGTWTTEGYTIENYITSDALLAAVKEVHPSVVKLHEPAKNRDPLLRLRRRNGSELKKTDKVAIAMTVSEQSPNLDVLDLRQRIAELVEFLRS